MAKGRLVIALAMLFLATGKAAIGQATQTVAIIKFVRHPALDATEAGAIHELQNAIRTKPGLSRLQIQQYVADGSVPNATQIAELVTSRKVTLIIAIATPAAQAVTRVPSDIPLVYGAVADPFGAGLLPSSRTTGVRNAGPGIILGAFKFIRAWFPQARAVGTVYNPSEQNSVYVQGLMQAAADSVGLRLVQLPVTDAASAAAAIESISRRVQVLYSANDNTVNAAIRPIADNAIALKKPFIIGDLSTLQHGPVAAVGLDYFSVGQEVGEMAIRILLGEPVTNVAPSGPPAPRIWVSGKVAARINARITQKARELADSIVR